MSRLHVFQLGLQLSEEFRTRNRRPGAGGMKGHGHPIDACQLRRQLRWNMSEATRLQRFDEAFYCEIILIALL